MDSLKTQITACRACKNPDLDTVINLGEQYVVDFVASSKDCLKAPLELVLCKSCHLLQLKHTVSKDRLFRKFWYRSGINEQMRSALKEVANRGYLAVDMDPGDLVLDIGCNDGTLLEEFPKFGTIKRVGVDPCGALVQEGVDRKRMEVGINGFFGGDRVLGMLKGFRRFKVITCVAMFYDVEDPIKFLEHCKELLHQDGVLIIQQNYLVGMLEQMAFDNICHEHLSYYTVSSMAALLEKVGLNLAGVETNDVNGGSFRIYATHQGVDITSYKFTQDFKLKLYTNEVQLRHKENLMKLYDPETYRLFESRMHVICGALAGSILDAHNNGKRVNVYGASTRGTTTMQCLDLPVDVLAKMKAAERDKSKIGLKMVGSWLPIVSEEECRKETDVFICLPWHFWSGIKIRERDFMLNGGSFLLPLPKPRMVNSAGEYPLLSPAAEVIQ